jgi:hypothetical protein
LESLAFSYRGGRRGAEDSQRNVRVTNAVCFSLALCFSPLSCVSSLNDSAEDLTISSASPLLLCVLRGEKSKLGLAYDVREPIEISGRGDD